MIILPYLEQENLFEQWNLDEPYYKQSDIARLTAIKTYFCPTRREPYGDPPASISGDWSPLDIHVPGALGDYAVCIDKSGHDTPKRPDRICPVRSSWSVGFDWSNLRMD